MSEVRRRLVRFLILVLPALLLLAGMYAVRGDLRDAASRPQNPGYMRDGNTFIMRRERADRLGPWTKKFIEELQSKAGLYPFKRPEAGFRIEVRSEEAPTRYEPGSNILVIWGISDDDGIEKIQPKLSRLITKAMLREGAPDAAFSPWFEEGVASFYESTQAEAVGSRKESLIARAARNPTSLASILSATEKSPNFDAVSHSIVVFLHENYSAEKIALYAAEERRPGPVPAGTFERIFGPEFEKAWREDLPRR